MINDNQNLIFSNKQKSKWIFDFQNSEKVSIKLNSSFINKKIKPEKNPIALRNNNISFFKELFNEARVTIENSFKHNNNGLFCARANSSLMVQIITLMFKTFKNNFRNLNGISIVATGGFGRCELAPYSDLDLLFLVSSKKNILQDQLIKFLLYCLWDLGIKVGHTTCTVNQVIKGIENDLTFKTAILDKRFIIGEKRLFNNLKIKFNILRKDTVSQFVKLKIKEQSQRHHKTGGSRYMLEPNVKESKGCIRDLNTIYWLSKYKYGFDSLNELKLYDKKWENYLSKYYNSLKYLMTVRCHLHYLSRRDNNILDIAAQEQIAFCLKYSNRKNISSVERLMKRFYLSAKDIGNLTRIFCNDNESFNKNTLINLNYNNKSYELSNFELKDNKLNFTLNHPNEKINPKDIFKIFQFSQSKNLDIHPSTLDIIISSKNLVGKIVNKDELLEIFTSILLSPNHSEKYLRLMSETGVLGKLFPDFQKITGLMQFNMYHHYTVDEHTLLAIGYLNKLEKGELIELAPIASSLIKKTQSRKILFLAVFLHDIGKGKNKDHTIVGENIANQVCQNLKLKDQETETITWLVRNHLLMSKYAFNYDVSDPKTILNFTNLVQSPEKLKLLLIITVVDILAVGPGIWNSWKAALMRDLYKYSEEVLYGADAYQLMELNPEKSKIQLMEALVGWKREDFEDFANLYPDQYWSSVDIDTHIWLAKIIYKKPRTKKITVNFKTLKKTDSLLLVVMAPDNPGLFSEIAAAISTQEINIETAKIFTRKDGIAADFFWISPGNRLVFNKSKLKNLEKLIIDNLQNKTNHENSIKNLWKSIPKRIRELKSTPQVFIDNLASNSQTVIEINGKNRPGLLYSLTKELNSLGLQIQSASVSSYGDLVVDVFYVKDKFGMKIENKDLEENIKFNLRKVLSEKMYNTL